MSRTYIALADVLSETQKGTKASSILSAVSSSVTTTKNSVDSKVLNKNNVSTQLSSIATTAGAISYDIDNIVKNVTNAVSFYSNNENYIYYLSQQALGTTIGKSKAPSAVNYRNTNRFSSTPPKMLTDLLLTPPCLSYPPILPKNLLEQKKSLMERYIAGEVTVGKTYSVWDKPGKDEDNYIRVLTGDIELSWTNGDKKYEQEIEKDKLPTKLRHEQTKKPSKSLNKNKDLELYEDNKVGTVLETKGEIKLEGSVLDAQASGKSKYAEGQAGVKLGNGEFHGSASAGLYVYDVDKNGNVTKTICPSVQGELGVSVCAVDISAEGRIGLGEDHNLLGVYGKGDVRGLSGEATIKGSVVIDPKNGKLELYGGASAEADLIKAEASAGVSVLGVDVGVKGAVKFGVGAHANVGYQNGVVKVDVGAALGFGVDVGFEVDVGAAVTKVEEGIAAISEDVDRAVNALTDFASSVWDKYTSWW